MNRRQFLVRATIGGATVPLLFTEIGCSDDDDNGNGGGGGSETFTSNNVNGHTHSITIPDSDFTAGGSHTYTSSNVQSHTHQVTLETSDIDNLTAGCVVVATSSNNSGHEHTWRIVVADFVSNIIVTSSLVDNHQHQVTVPANGLLAEVPVSQNLTTTPVLSHQHILTLDPGDWTLLQECSNVTKSTNPDGTGHAHSFTITRA